MALDADLADEEEVARLLPAAAEALGPIGCWSTMPRCSRSTRIDTVTRDSWDRHLEADLRAPVVLIQALARQLPESAGGVVVNMLDERVWNLTPYFLSYTLSQGGSVDTDADAWRWRWRRASASTASVPARPCRARARSQSSSRANARRCRCGAAPARRRSAAALRFILAAPAMTGQMIALDGGQHLGWAVPRRDLPPDD